MAKAMRLTDWPALCRLATELRGGVACDTLRYATNGLHNIARLNNMARLLQFKDGVLCVAGVAMRRSAADAAKLRSEVDTMRWIRARSRLPVPEVFAYCVDENNAVGIPFVLLPLALRPCFYRAVAACHVQMTGLRLPQIGTVG